MVSKLSSPLFIQVLSKRQETQLCSSNLVSWKKIANRTVSSAWFCKKLPTPASLGSAHPFSRSLRCYACVLNTHTPYGVLTLQTLSPKIGLFRPRFHSKTNTERADSPRQTVISTVFPKTQCVRQKYGNQHTSAKKDHPPLARTTFARLIFAPLEPHGVQTASWTLYTNDKPQGCQPQLARRKPPQDGHHRGDRRPHGPLTALARLPVPPRKWHSRSRRQRRCLGVAQELKAPRFLHCPMGRGRARLAGQTGER